MSNPLHVFETDTGEYDLSGSAVTVFSATNSDGFTRKPALKIDIGDGTKNLASSVINALTIEVFRGGVFINQLSYAIPATYDRASVDTDPIIWPSGETLSVKISSNQSGDNDVAISVSAVDTAPLQPLSPGGTYPSSSTGGGSGSGSAGLYCSKEDVDDIWSEEGIVSRFDDDSDGSLSASEELRINRFIQRASIYVGSMLKGRFQTLSYFEGSNPPVDTPDSIRYMTAIVAAYYLSSRRGIPVPAEVKQQYKEVKDWLLEIKNGGGLPIDLSEEFDHTPFTSNFNVSSIYLTNKVRVTRGNSTRDEPTTGIKRAREYFIGFPFF